MEMEKQELTDKVIKVWDKGIDVQIHFNDLIMKNRTIVISFVTAIFGTAAISLRNADLKVSMPIYAEPIHVGALIFLFGIFFLVAYAYLDICYYLKLLIGAVNFTKKLDNGYKGLGLTTEINRQIKPNIAPWILSFHYLIMVGAASVVFMILWKCFEK